MKIITLTVQSNGKKKWRLGLNTDDSIHLFKHKEIVKFILPNNSPFLCKAVCGTSNKKAFDFNNTNINQWILDNKFEKYPPRKPTKLQFTFTTESPTFTFFKRLKKVNEL